MRRDQLVLEHKRSKQKILDEVDDEIAYFTVR